METNLELETTSPEVKQYQRSKIFANILSAVLALAWLAVLAFVLGPRLGEWMSEHLPESRALGLLVMAAVVGISLELLSLPIDFWSSYLLEHRYKLSNQTLGGWIWKRVKGYLVGGILGLVMVFGLYGIIWLTGEWWWVCATIGFLFLSLVLGQLVPVLILPLFYKVTRFDDANLVERMHRLVQGTGLNVEGVYRLHLSEETKKANAALAGLGSTRRVLLGDTLIDEFTPEEIEVVFAHEVGHHVHKHLPKMVVLSCLLSFCGFWIVDRVIGMLSSQLGYGGIEDPTALPLLLFVLAIFGLVLSPLQNAISRYFEVQCDTYALERTQNREAYRSAFIKLARMNKSDPDPHPLVAFLFYDHPPIRERLALADARV